MWEICFYEVRYINRCSVCLGIESNPWMISHDHLFHALSESICSKIGHATIITCVTPPYIFFIMGLRLLLHALSCCIYTALIPCLAAYSLYTALVSLLFGTVIPIYILQHFNGNVFIPFIISSGEVFASNSLFWLLSQLGWRNAARQGMKAVYMQQDNGWGHATIITCVTPPYIHLLYCGVTHVTAVSWFIVHHHNITCYIIISLLFKPGPEIRGQKPHELFSPMSMWIKEIPHHV